MIIYDLSIIFFHSRSQTEMTNVPINGSWKYLWESVYCMVIKYFKKYSGTIQEPMVHIYSLIYWRQNTEVGPS